MLFSKKMAYTPTEVAEGLYLLSASDEAVNASIQLYAKSGGALDAQLQVRLRWHIYVLHLFACDYACFQKYGDSALKRQILDAFYRQIVYNLSGQSNDKEITRAVIAEIDAFGSAAREKSLDDLLLAIGKVFADSVNEPSDSLQLRLAGSAIFTQFSLAVKEWLDERRA